MHTFSVLEQDHHLPLTLTPSPPIYTQSLHKLNNTLPAEEADCNKSSLVRSVDCTEKKACKMLFWHQYFLHRNSAT